MQKLAEFVVKGRVPIFVISLILAVVSAFAMTHIVVERDPATFLPQDSMTRQGLDVMAEEFEESSLLKVMFGGLADAQIDDVAEDLEALPHVLSVTWEEGEDGTPAEGKVLYTVNLEGNAYSLASEAGVKEIQEYSEGMDVAIAGTALDTMNQLSTLGLNIVLAIAILLAILFLMCSSWIEPLLFLLAIGIAVLYNMGTCALLPSIGIMTFAVAAVLQLALSMDYSIMLTDRYRQERLLTDDKELAMINALKGAFTAISASSLTTIAGMLCLCAMSFAIGQDMGLVLGKGVAFSVLSVLLILPGIMVIFDGAIQKTSKPYPRPQLKLLARFSYFFRFLVLIVFAGLLVLGFWAKENAGVNFFMSYDSKDQRAIEEAFPPTEQIVLLYESDAQTGDALLQVEEMDGVASVQSYETTLGKELTADKLAEELDMDPLAVDLMYYVHANGTATGTLSVAEFASFVEDTVAANPQFSSMVDADALDQMEQLANLADPAYIAEERTAAQMAAALSLDAEDVRRLYMLYFIENGAVETGTMTTTAFVAYLQEASAPGAPLAGMFDDATRAQLGQLAQLTNVASVTEPLTSEQMAQALGIDAPLVEQVYRYYLLMTNDLSWYLMTIQQVFNVLVDEIAVDPLYAASFDEATLAQLALMRDVAGNAAWSVELTPEQLAQMLGMDQGLVQFVFELVGSAYGAVPPTMTVTAFLNTLLDGLVYNPEALSWLPELAGQTLQAQAPQLEQLRFLANTAALREGYNAVYMAQLLGMDNMLMYQVYLNAMLADGSVALPLISIEQFLAFVIDGMVPNPQFAGMFDETALAGLMQARAVVNASTLGTELDALGLASLLGLDYEQVYQIMAYRAYSLDPNADAKTMDLDTLVPYLLALTTGDENSEEDGSAGGDALAEFDADEGQLSKLTFISKVMDGAKLGAVYTVTEMAELLQEASPDLDATDVQLLYLLQAATTDEATQRATMTFEQFVDYAADEFTDIALFADVISADQEQEFVDAKDILADAKDQLLGAQFGRAIIEAEYQRESQEMQDLVNQILDVMEETGTKFYLVGDAAMATEMRASFSDEFNFITLLTAGVIFLIVLLAFRSLFVPLLLVAVIQTAINLTMGITVLQDISTYYVALMVVQALLMGATIDYGILFTESYREMRQKYDPREAIARAFKTSIGTIMTSSSILVLVTFAVGMTSADVTIAEVCLTISKGSLVAVSLVVLILPGLLAALDPLVGGPKRMHDFDGQNDHPTPPGPPKRPARGLAGARPESPAAMDTPAVSAGAVAVAAVASMDDPAAPANPAEIPTHEAALEREDEEEDSSDDDFSNYIAAHFSSTVTTPNHTAGDPATISTETLELDEAPGVRLEPTSSNATLASEIDYLDQPYGEDVWAELLRLAAPERTETSADANPPTEQ